MSLFGICHCLSSVVVGHLSLFGVCHLPLFVIYRCLSLLVGCPCLVFVVICRLSFVFVVVYRLLEVKVVYVIKFVNVVQVVSGSR